MNNAPLMPMATAVWLVENTTLTFKQIADFCNLHEVEIQGIADGDVAKGIVGYNPIIAGQLTKEEIELSSKDQSRPLKINNYGFLEPIEKRRSISPDIIVVPLLAYDKFYNRLGYGKGYYDRFLRKHEKNKKNVLTIGLAFSFQKYKKIPASGLDVKLDYILTEKGIF